MQEQATVAAALDGMNATVISQYTKAYNGMLVSVPANQLQVVRGLPGVKAGHPAPVHHLELAASVPLIGADAAWADFDVDGDGISIAVIDTGIDYTHAALAVVAIPLIMPIMIQILSSSGTFPTAKVVGGWDFAGTNYDASDPDNEIPIPDPDPLDENGHGSHVSSTAAGVGVAGTIGEGVAPAASLYALKVFGAEWFY